MVPVAVLSVVERRTVTQPFLHRFTYPIRDLCGPLSKITFLSIHWSEDNLLSNNPPDDGSFELFLCALSLHSTPFTSLMVSMGLLGRPNADGLVESGTTDDDDPSDIGSNDEEAGDDNDDDATTTCSFLFIMDE